MAIRVTSLGGSGEDSRNCFLVQYDAGSFLLDCGVRREIADVSWVYPLLTEEIARNLSAVILSHAHEDHTAALPYLYELGYRGPVYAAPETIAQTPTFLRKWADYVKEHGGTLPFDEENIKKIDFRSAEECPLKFTCGRDGHILGGLWYRFELEGHSLLYTGDLTYDSLVLEADPLPVAETLIIDSAYAGKVLDQRIQYERLAETAREVTAAGGKLLLPVPANGRGIDMLVYLSKCGLPLFAESNIVKNAQMLFLQMNWVKLFALREQGFTAVDASDREAVLAPEKAGVYLFGDGMMTSPVSADYFEAVKADSRSRILVTGHSAKGTLANSLLDEGFRKENGIEASAEQLTIKVHNDEADVLRLAEQVHPKNVMLFHSKGSACTALKEKLEARKIRVICHTGQELVTDPGGSIQGKH